MEISSGRLFRARDQLGRGVVDFSDAVVVQEWKTAPRAYAASQGARWEGHANVFV